MANILSIGQTALNAAQVGLATTGHNIANASTEGFSRQVVVQGSLAGAPASFGSLGKGTEVQAVKRVYNEFLTNQVLNSHTSQNGLSSYYTQIKQINNMFADPTVGVTPALQEFFKGVQNLAANPASGAARQTVLSSAQTLAGQFQDVSGRLDSLREGVNSDIRSGVDTINSLATQIAKLNDSISTVQASNSGKAPNDLLDQRDKLVSDLSKEIKVTVVKQGTDYNISIGNGQSLIVGGKTFELTPVVSATDPSRLQVGYKSNGNTISLAEASLSGGKMGGVLEFRSQTLDKVQNELGRIAIGLGSAFNAQHQLGQDLNGDLGGDLFKVAVPRVNSSSMNTGTAQAAANITNPGALTASDYRFEFIGPAEYRVTRMADGALTSSTTLPISVDGLEFQVTSGTMAAGDVFMVKPTIDGASAMGVLISDTAKLAAAAPVRTGANSVNAGSGAISAGSVDASFGFASVSPPITLQYDAATNTLSGFPASLGVTVSSPVASDGTNVGGAASALDFSIADVNGGLGFNDGVTVTDFDYSGGGANVAQMDIDGIGITLTANYGDADGVAAAIESQLNASAGSGAYTVTNTAGNLKIQNNNAATAVAITNTDANANLAGFTNGSGTAGVVGTQATFTVDGTPVSLSGNYADRNALAAAIQGQLSGYAVTAGTGGALTITHTGNQQAVAVAGLSGNELTNLGLSNSPGTGSASVYAPGAPVTFVEGATISFGGVSFTMSGNPANGDRFTVGPNTNGVGDNRNALLMGALQSAKTLVNGTATLQGAFGQMVNMVGNKTHELDVNMTAENTMLAQVVAAQQSVSGVNLDEEAANLLRYQQAYQAAGKVMQTASKMFDVLLSLGQ